MAFGCTVVPTTATVLVMICCDVVVGDELVGVLDDVVAAVVVGMTGGLVGQRDRQVLRRVARLCVGCRDDGADDLRAVQRVRGRVRCGQAQVDRERPPVAPFGRDLARDGHPGRADVGPGRRRIRRRDRTADAIGPQVREGAPVEVADGYVQTARRIEVGAGDLDRCARRGQPARRVHRQNSVLAGTAVRCRRRRGSGGQRLGGRCLGGRTPAGGSNCPCVLIDRDQQTGGENRGRREGARGTPTNQ